MMCRRTEDGPALAFFTLQRGAGNATTKDCTTASPFIPSWQERRHEHFKLSAWPRMHRANNRAPSESALMRRFLVAAGLLVGAAVVLPNVTVAEGGWPTAETMRLVVPYAAGSNGDSAGRIVAEYLGKTLPGATIIVENRPGAGGIVGTRSFTRSAPDGYTICVCSGGAITVPSTVEKLYDPLKDLVPISRLSTSPLVLAVPPNSAATSVAALVALSKSSPASLNYGSSGIGGVMYNTAEIFRNKTGARIIHVPFRSGPEVMIALIAGRIDLAFAIMSDALGQVTAKTVRPLAVTTATRSALLPDVPSMTERGIAGFDMSVWNGLFAPPGTPRPIIDTLSKAMQGLPGDPKVQQAMASVGSTATVSNTPEQFGEELAEEAARWDVDLKNVVRN
jgi:tripartite-type tricarboxylate transporter receptor subunit TctC